MLKPQYVTPIIPVYFYYLRLRMMMFRWWFCVNDVNADDNENRDLLLLMAAMIKTNLVIAVT
jgi:hypothetical protein